VANKEKSRPRVNQYIKNKILTDPFFKLKKTIRTAISKAFKNSGFTKKSKTYEILGCSFEEFKRQIETQFEPWMNWNNHGKYNGEFNYGWDLDHIKPISLAKTEEDLLTLSMWTNFQPLCSKTNREIKMGNYLLLAFKYPVGLLTTL
jgi:hypothetical protein